MFSFVVSLEAASFVLSAFLVSSFTTAVVSVLSLAVSCTFAAFSTVLGASSVVAFVSVFVVFCVVVLSDTCSLACATVPTPKKILAPITTDAAPTLNFLIE